MKKLWIFAALVCLFSTLVGCKHAGGAQNDDDNKTKFGMAVVGDADVDADEAKLSAVAAAVLTDDDGVILACRLDELELEPAVVNGNLKKPAELRTKRERGDSYGMKAAGAKQEWYEQAEAFCKYVIGKTGTEVAGIQTVDGKATDKDLSAGCTITVTAFMQAVSKAAAEATEQALAASDKLGLAMTASVPDDVDDEAKYTVRVSAVTVDPDGKVTGCVVDEMEKTLVFADGKLSGDEGEIKTKKQLEDRYAMKSASSIGLEWYEQVENLQKYLVGKTDTDIGNVPLTDGKPADADLASGCTVVVTGMLQNVQKAIKNAV